MSQPSSSVEAARARRRLRDGCQSYVACLAVPVVLGILIFLGGSLNRIASRLLIDPQSVSARFTNLERIAGQIVLVSGLVLLVTSLVIWAIWEKSKVLGILTMLPLMALSLYTGYSLLYEGFIAITARNGELQFHYRWPRPSTTIHASSVRSTEIEKVSTPEMTPWDYRLWIDTGSDPYQSEATANQGEVERSTFLVMREKHAHEILLAEGSGNTSARLAAMGRLALMDIRLGKRDEAAAICRQALSLSEEHADELGIASAAFCLGQLADHDQRFDEAERHYVRSLEIRRRLLDDEHPDRYDVALAYAALLDATQRPEEARQIRGLLPPRTILSEMRRSMSKEEAEQKVRDMLEKRRKDRED